MSINVDPNAAHAVYAPSSAHRWTVCTASATAIAALGEQEEGDAAKKGTEAHSELERVLNGGEPDQDHPGAYGVALAVDFVRQLPLGRVWIEERVHLTENIWGRLDFGHWDAESATVTIEDLKDGFVDVSAERNSQLRIYAAALIQQYKLPAKWIRYVICQPNSIAPGPRIKQWVESAEDLHAFASAAAAVPNSELKFVAGEACKYCPLFGKCPASQDVLAQLSAAMCLSAEDVRPDQVALFKAMEKPTKDWFASLDKVALKRTLSGTVIPGLKVVMTSKHLAWKDEAAARAAIVEKLGVDALDPPTPAQAKKLGMTEADVAILAERPEGGPALAFESDRRPTWASKSAAEMFAGVIDASR